MAVTFNTFAGNGTTGPFSFTFEYIDESDVKVSIDGTTQSTTAYTFPTASTIQFVSLTPTAQQTIRIFRETDVDNLKATFFAGSSIRSQDLNNNFEQNNFAVQEIKDQYVTEENGEFSTNVDMNSNRITDMADPVNAQDAVTKQYLEDNYFDDGTETILAAETWPDNDTTIATTAAIDNRVDSKIDTAIENDVLVNNTGLTKSATGGQVTLGIGANSVDLDRIKDSDKITLSEQESDNDQVGTDDQIFTAQAATRRFNNYYQNDAPTATDGIGVGQVWVDPNDDLTLSVWTGSAWSAITSGGTFSNQPKVVYVDAGSGDDSNDGHRISRPKKTIRAALSDINADSTNGDGSIISVAPGIYAETLPLDIEKNDVGIIGQSLRTCIIHPLIPEADRDGYDVDTPHSQELQTMFRVNSGSYFQNLTLTGLKASGTRGDTGSLYTDSTHGLPPNQGWNFAFLPNATIKKSPYIQNCTNFSDSQINNLPANFSPHVPGEGAAGDLDSAPTGGGILVDGSVPATASPLRSMVADSYTHTALDGPGILVTNNGYAQCTSSYAFFNHAHITCLNGGQANLAASTTDFGRFALVADGKSPTAIFTSNVDGAAANEATTFNINAPTAAADWFGDATRPANNMLVTVNSVTYPVLSATPRNDSEGGAGFTVTISRPDTSDRSVNKGLNGAVSDNAAVSFFLRSMIASSGHTMEYVGSGTNYTALPENGGVPIDSNQIIEKNDGKVWTATTDHKGTFKVGDFFTVDQSAGTLAVDSGSFKVNLGTLDVNVGGDAVVGADLDMSGNEITTSSGALKLNAANTGGIDVNSNKIINVATPTADGHAATKGYVDTNTFGQVSEDDAPTLGGNLNVSTFKIISGSNDRDITIDPHGTGDIILDANVGIKTTSPVRELQLGDNTSSAEVISLQTSTSGNGSIYFGDNAATSAEYAGMLRYSHSDDAMLFWTSSTERVRIDSSGRLMINTTSAATATSLLTVSNTGACEFNVIGSAASVINLGDSDDHNIGRIKYDQSSNSLQFNTNNSERLRIDSSGRLLVGTTTEGNANADNLTIADTGNCGITLRSGTTSSGFIYFSDATSGADEYDGYIHYSHNTRALRFATATTERLRIDSSGNVGIGDSSPDARCVVYRATQFSGNTVFAVKSDAGSTKSTKFMVDGDGKVGVGTTSPFRSVHVSGSSDQYVRITSTNSSNAGIEFGDSDDAGRASVIYSNSTDSMFFTVNGSERARIDSSGRVGIGNTTMSSFTGNASDNLVVGSGSGGEGITVYSATNNQGSLTFADGTSGDAAYRGAVEYSHTNDHLAFRTAGTGNRMVIDSSGRLLVGTTSAVDSGATSSLQVVNTSTAIIALGRNDSSISAGNDLGAIRFYGNDGGSYQQCAEILAEADGDHANNDKPSRLVFSTTADSGSSPTERMRIHSTGNVSFAEGIVLGAGVNDTAANTLDDYEEGTWTPAPAFDGTTTDVAGTFQGNYTRIGRLVTVFCSLQFTNNGTGNGANTISGLPFDVADTFTNSVNAEFSGSVGFFANGGDRERATYGIVALSGTDDCQLYGGSNTNHADLDVALDDDSIVNNSSIRFTLQYIAA